MGGFAYLCDFSQSAAFLAEVNNDATTAILCLLDCLFDAEDEVGSAGANVGPKNIATVALYEGVMSVEVWRMGRRRKRASSWMRSASLLDGSDILAGSPKT